MSEASGGTVTRSCAFRYASASSARSRIIAGWPPAGTYLFFTASSAFSQSSPNPSSRDAFFISASHHAYSRLPISMSCSGVYGIISPARSSRRPARPIGSPTISSSPAAGSGACPPRPPPRPPPAPGAAATAGAAPARPPIFCRSEVEYAVSALRHRLVGRRHRPGERGVVDVVEREPLLERAAQRVDALRGPHADGRRHARRLHSRRRASSRPRLGRPEPRRRSPGMAVTAASAVMNSSF